jgi:hypothetical protein
VRSDKQADFNPLLHDRMRDIASNLSDALLVRHQLKRINIQQNTNFSMVVY